jgi:hypothetical protein
MKRFRLSSLLFMVVIVALSFALVEQGRRASRREAELRAKIAKLEQAEIDREWMELSERRLRHAGMMSQPGGGPNAGKPTGR